MKTQQILNNLTDYISQDEVSAISIVYGHGITIVLKVANVIRNYNSTTESEEELTELLTQLLKNHFNSL